jgi:hypothetical protein
LYCGQQLYTQWGGGGALCCGSLNNVTDSENDLTCNAVAVWTVNSLIKTIVAQCHLLGYVHVPCANRSEQRLGL